MSTSKAILYQFEGSCWAAVAHLTVIEKGFTPEQIEIKSVNLVEGQNFSPEYLKINPKGTVPSLVVPYEDTIGSEQSTKFKSVTDSIEASKLLDSFTLGNASGPRLSPATIQGSQDSEAIIAAVHKEDAPDPNFLLLSFRTDEERKAKLADLPGKFLKGRQAALVKYTKDSGDSDGRRAIFYEKKIADNGNLLAKYEGEQSAADFMEASKKAWAGLPKTLAVLDKALSAGSTNSTFLIGDQVSLADLHAAGWLLRIFAVAGATELDPTKAVAALDKELPAGEKVPASISKWLEALFERESFKTVYKEGLH